ncbi:MAG: hypothetical protein JW751_18110 [Polyangiaceae bacterium]|nr:hypothetical protein [Polyangiaceae bacterium]
MDHVLVAARSTSRDDLEQRLTGRYYTPPVIAERLAVAAAASGIPPTSVGDPFAGDGRLIVAFLREAAVRGALGHLRRVWLWDRSGGAIEQARSAVAAELALLGAPPMVAVTAETHDTFTRIQGLRGRLDLVLTNPPWDLLKPDVRDQVGEAAAYAAELRTYAASLTAAFPAALSARGKSRPHLGINLARAGALAAIATARPGGFVGLVLPASLLSDQASAPFRAELFARIKVIEIAAYPAEARLFAGVDQPCATIVGVGGEPTHQFRLLRFDRGLAMLDERTVALSPERGAPLALGVAADQARLVAAWSARFPTLSALEEDPRHQLWLGRELDETRIAAAFTHRPDGIPFLKGRHVFPYRVARDRVDRVDPTQRKIPATVRALRLAWRDVSRPNQRRRMHVALVPPGNVTGNSLGVACFRAGAATKIELLMALMNGFVFELQIRARLATAHVSQGVVRTCTVPMACFEDAELGGQLARLVTARTQVDAPDPRLEVLLARAHALTREELACVLDAFPKVAAAERQTYLARDLWA